MSITARTNTLLLESGDANIDRFHYIFEKAIEDGYDICRDIDNLPYGFLFEDILDLRALADEEMMRSDEEFKASEMATFLHENPKATQEDIESFEFDLDEQMCYDRSYSYGDDDGLILEAAMELGYCVMSSIDITWDIEGGYPKFVEIDIFNCPQRSILKPFKEELGTMSFGLTIRK